MESTIQKEAFLNFLLFSSSKKYFNTYILNLKTCYIAQSLYTFVYNHSMGILSKYIEDKQCKMMTDTSKQFQCSLNYIKEKIS